MRLTRVVPRRGNPFAGPGPSYQPDVGGAMTPSSTDLQSPSNDDAFRETPLASPRCLHNDWQIPLCEPLTAPCRNHQCMSHCEPPTFPRCERSGAQGAVPGPKDGRECCWIPYHKPPTAPNTERGGAQGAAPDPKGGYQGWCTQPFEVPTSQPERYNGWHMPQYAPLTSPNHASLCIPQQYNDANGAVCYFMPVQMVMVIPMSHFAQDNQRLKADVPASGDGLHTETILSGSVAGWHQNAGGRDPMWAWTARESAWPGPNDIAASGEVPARFTTLVIRNIPVRYMRKMLLQEFGGPDGSFDYFYQPFSFREHKTRGIAFMNFQSYPAALCFQEVWHGRFLRNHGHTKHLDVAAATIQGLAGNLEQFNLKSIARLDHVGMLPAFFDDTGKCLDSITELHRHGVLPSASKK